MTAYVKTPSDDSSPTMPREEPALFGLDLSVLAQSYGWALNRHGHLFGLTRGKDHYEFTGIRFDNEALRKWSHEYTAPAAFATLPQTVSTEREALDVARKSEQRLRHELNLVRHMLKDAGLTQQSDDIALILHSTPTIPTVAPAATPPRETGPWKYGRDQVGGKQFLESDDFTHDVRLYINGDFADDAQREAYGQMLAKCLNEALRALPRPTYSLTEMKAPQGESAWHSAQLHRLVVLLRESLLAAPSEFQDSDNKRVMRFAHDAIANYLGLTPCADARTARPVSPKKPK